MKRAPYGQPSDPRPSAIIVQPMSFGPKAELLRMSCDPLAEPTLCTAGVLQPGDSVLIQPPVYAHFHNDVLINGRHLALAPLQRTEDGYRFDPAAFEAAIRADTKLFILSHPHNPTGNVWSEEELSTMGEICARHDVLVISDEIHEDLIINPDPRRREEFSRHYERNLFGVVNLLGMVAAEAAYAHGEPWLEQLLPYLRENHRRFAEAVHAATNGIRVLRSDALYLAWMDCRGLGMDAAALEHFMLTRARLWLDRGQKFGLEGHGYMRVNLGCPRATVEEAVARLTAAVGEETGTG